MELPHANVTHANGKVILLGEHAVVYGHPALAGALKAGVTVRVVAGSGALLVPAWNATFSPTAAEGPPLALAFAALHTSLGIAPRDDVDYVAEFEIPTGAGLGSSGALAVAVARAICNLASADASPARIKAAAMASETVIHGKPSGLDHTVACDGGFGLFTREGGLVPLHAPTLRLIIGHTGRERDTKGRVGRIAELLVNETERTRAHFAEIDALVNAGARAMSLGDYRALGAAMNENQHHLAALEVSSTEIETMREIALAAGALGAKLTGGGGGGCVIALAPGGESEIMAAWKARGFVSFVTDVGGAVLAAPKPLATAAQAMS